jgi:hypothetical protein
MVGGHCYVPDGGHQAGTAAVTDGEWSPGDTGFAKRAERRLGASGYANG